jgi:hypothetical protein
VHEFAQTFMKTKILLWLVVPVAMAALIYGYVQMSEEKAADEEGDQPISSVSSVQRDTNGSTFINLDLGAQKLIGLHAAPLAAATQPPEVAAYGRVLDPAPLVAQLGDTAAARAALDTSRKEYLRQKDLYAQGQNTSAKALEAAQAAMEHDQITLTTARTQLVAAWGKAVADETDLAAFVQSLAQLASVLVRLDLPAGETMTGTPIGARLVVPGVRQPVAACFLGRAATTDPRVQGEGFLFVATNAPAALTPGLAVTGFIQLPGAQAHGVVVPDAAIVRSSGQTWVYAQTGDTTFARREVVLDHPVVGGWFVTNGVAPGERLVITGAQALLSEERKTEIKLED